MTSPPKKVFEILAPRPAQIPLATESGTSPMPRFALLAVTALLLLTAVSAVPTRAAPPNTTRPNIVLIMSDDMGFSDLGCYGGEIQTPTLDRLASGGVRLTQFYNTARCCPTRAALLTGLYPHQAGIGHMMEDKGAPGYTGNLNDKCR